MDEVIEGKNPKRRVVVVEMRHPEGGTIEIFHAETRPSPASDLWHRSKEGGGPRNRAEAETWVGQEAAASEKPPLVRYLDAGAASGAGLQPGWYILAPGGWFGGGPFDTEAAAKAEIEQQAKG